MHVGDLVQYIVTICYTNVAKDNLLRINTNI